MGISETYSRGRDFAVERPLSVVMVLVGVGFVVDLVRQLAVGSLSFAQFGTFVWQGLVLGLSIGLAGIGLSMTYSILNFANFGHGDYVTWGAFSGWAVTWLLAGLDTEFGLANLFFMGNGISTRELNVSIATTPLSILVGLLVATVATIALAVLLDRVVYRPMRDEEGISLLIASIGVALALRYTIVLIYNQRTRGLTAASEIPEFAIPAVDGVINVSGHELTLVVVAAALMLGVHLLLQKTKLGKAMRAMADNENLARVTGIPTERVVLWTWIIGGGLAGAGGYLIALERGTMNFNLGWLLLLLIFAAVIMGGIGSIYGAMLGGLVMGIASNVSLVWIPSEFSSVAAFGIMILVLLFKPSGLFSGRTTA